MKRNMLFGIASLLAGSLLAADSTPEVEVANAAKQLGEQVNYSWRTTVTVPATAPFLPGFRPGPTRGKTEKEGMLAKYEFTVTGTVEFFGKSFDNERT